MNRNVQRKKRVKRDAARDSLSRSSREAAVGNGDSARCRHERPRPAAVLEMVWSVKICRLRSSYRGWEEHQKRGRGAEFVPRLAGCLDIWLGSLHGSFAVATGLISYVMRVLRAVFECRVTW